MMRRMSTAPEGPSPRLEISPGARVVPEEALRAKLGGLRRWNAAMAALHLAQAAVMLAVASSFSLPVTSSFLRMDTVTEKLVAVPDELVRLQVGPLVAGFLFLSALAHAALASPWLHGWYERNVSRGINPARWVEYSLSSSLMMVVIAMLVGIYDVASLILIFALNSTMILFGWLMELHNQTTRADELDGLLVRLLRRCRAVDRGRRLPRGGRRGARVRLRDLRLALRLLQRVRRQHAAPVQAGGPLERLPVRGARVHAAQPVREVRARLAGLRGNAPAGLNRLAGDGVAHGWP